MPVPTLRLTLTAKDEAGNEGHSEPFNMRLPRAAVHQAVGAGADRAAPHPCARCQPARAGPDRARRADDRAGNVHAGGRAISRSLRRRRGSSRPPTRDDALREVVASLWALAVTIEDGDITDVDKALRAAQDALKQALERGASDEEIKKLTQDLRAALDNFLRQLAEQHAQQSASPGPPARSQHQGDAPAGSQQHDRAHGAAVALRRQGCRQATARPAAGRCWKICRWRSPASPATATWSRR